MSVTNDSMLQDDVLTTGRTLQSAEEHLKSVNGVQWRSSSTPYLSQCSTKRMSLSEYMEKLKEDENMVKEFLQYDNEPNRLHNGHGDQSTK